MQKISILSLQGNKAIVLRHALVPRGKLRTAITTSNELAIAVLAPTFTRVRVSDTTRANTRRLAMVLDPEESPAVLLVFHVTGSVRRRACIGRASTVWSSVSRVVLMIRLEYSKGLSVARAGVVRALSGLDGCGHFCSIAAQGSVHCRRQ